MSKKLVTKMGIYFSLAAASIGFAYADQISVTTGKFSPISGLTFHESEQYCGLPPLGETQITISSSGYKSKDGECKFTSFSSVNKKYPSLPDQRPPGQFFSVYALCVGTESLSFEPSYSGDLPHPIRAFLVLNPNQTKLSSYMWDYQFEDNMAVEGCEYDCGDEIVEEPKFIEVSSFQVCKPVPKQVVVSDNAGIAKNTEIKIIPTSGFYKVVGGGVNVRVGPGKNYKNQYRPARPLSTGDIIQVTGASGSYLQFKRGGQTVYAWVDRLKPVQ